jgi:glycerophosphoryl diester phosphodiesterase
MFPRIFAHRGASADAPENTLSAFALAIEQGADGIELDVQMSADGELVVIHDEKLDRTTNGKGLVVQHRYEELKRLDASKGFGKGYKNEPIPLLSQVLDLVEPTNLELNIELKNGIIPYHGMEEKVIAMVREYGMEKRVIFSSFNHYSVVKMAQLAPEIETAILYVSGLYEPWNYVAPYGIRALHPYFHAAVPEIVKGAHQAGLKVRPYTVNKTADMKRMIAIGVDAIITNYPKRLKKLRKEMK